MESARERTVRKRMEATRQNILAHARTLITNGGVGALTARTLAQSASVSLSTLYSLVGKREDILAAVLTEMQERVRERTQAKASSSGLDNVETLANEVAALYTEDEAYYRAAYLALEHLDESTMRTAAVLRVYDWGEAMICAGLKQCAAEGLLRGRVPIAMLGDFAVQSYRGAYRRWSFGYLSIGQARMITLAQSYIALMADATEDFQRVLDERMQVLAAEPGFDDALIDSEHRVGAQEESTR